MKLKSLFVYVFFFILAACSPSKRLQRLLESHPELMSQPVDSSETYIIKTDTIKITEDTIRVVNRDTVINTDSTIIYITRDSIVYIRKPFNIIQHDTLRIKRISYIKPPITPKETSEPWYIYYSKGWRGASFTLIFIVVSFYLIAKTLSKDLNNRKNDSKEI